VVEAPTLTCTRCGERNGIARLFCRRCGLGLRLALPAGASSPVDAPVGSLYVHGIAGGLCGLLVSGLILLGLVEALKRWSNDLVIGARILSWHLGYGLPAMFLLGAAIGVHRRFDALGLGGSLARSLLGGVWALGIGLLAAPWAGEIAVLGACLVGPVAAARFGIGLFRPWLGPRLLALGTAGALGVWAASWNGGRPEGRVLMDSSGECLILGSAGTVLLLEGLQPPRRLATLPDEAVGIAWHRGSGVVALRDGRLARLSGEVRWPLGPPGPWIRLIRLGDRLLVIAESGLHSVRWLDGGSASELVWAASQGRPLALQLGDLARSALVPLEGGDLIEVMEDGTTRHTKATLSPLARAVAREPGDGRLCAVLGRHIVCRAETQGAWQRSTIGLRVESISGLCSLGRSLAVGTRRGLYLGRGTAAAPFRLVIAGRIEAVQASEAGAVAVGSDRLYLVDATGRWTARSWTDATELGR
jgi:hypothetical protein